MDFCLIFKFFLSVALISGMAVILLGPSYLAQRSSISSFLFNFFGILSFILMVFLILMIIWIPETRTIFA